MPIQRPLLHLFSWCPASLLLHGCKSGILFLHQHPELTLLHAMTLPWVYCLPAWPSKAPVLLYPGFTIPTIQHGGIAPLPFLSAILADHLHPIQILISTGRMSLLSLFLYRLWAEIKADRSPYTCLMVRWIHKGVDWKMLMILSWAKNSKILLFFLSKLFYLIQIWHKRFYYWF